jgi:hypothetical protein
VFNAWQASGRPVCMDPKLSSAGVFSTGSPADVELAPINLIVCQATNVATVAMRFMEEFIPAVHQTHWFGISLTVSCCCIDRPNLCRVTHKQPAAVGTQPHNFSAGGGYVPYVGTSVVRDSQMLLTRLYYRCAWVPPRFKG